MPSRLIGALVPFSWAILAAAAAKDGGRCLRRPNGTATNRWPATAESNVSLRHSEYLPQELVTSVVSIILEERLNVSTELRVELGVPDEAFTGPSLCQVRLRISQHGVLGSIGRCCGGGSSR
jgi:hypothetical protein